MKDKRTYDQGYEAARQEVLAAAEAVHAEHVERIATLEAQLKDGHGCTECEGEADVRMCWNHHRQVVWAPPGTAWSIAEMRFVPVEQWGETGAE